MNVKQNCYNYILYFIFICYYYCDTGMGENDVVSNQAMTIDRIA